MSKFYNIIRYFIDKKSTRVVQASINKYKENIISLLSIELEHIFLWVPVFIGLGIAIYFYTHPFNKEFIESLVEETQCPLMPKSYWIFFIFFITLLLLLAYIFRNRQVVLLLCIVVALILIGYIAAEIRVFWLKAPYIRDKISDVVITGVIEQVEEFENYQRLTLSDIGITDTSIERLPIKIRVNIKTFCDAEIGDHILFNATLMPPPYPVIPGGFNFARFAYFKQIGGIGYATSHVQIIKKRDDWRFTPIFY